LQTAVPQRNREMVVRLRRVRSKCDRALEVTNGRRELSLLPEREAEQRVRLCVSVVEAKRLFEVLARPAQIALPERVLRASIQIVRRARGGGARFSRRAALLLQRVAERVVGLAHLRIDLERPLEPRDRAGEAAALREGLADLALGGWSARIGL